MILSTSNKLLHPNTLLLLLLTLNFASCAAQVDPASNQDGIVPQIIDPAKTGSRTTTFAQIHTNLNGMVREFVRTMYQDKNGNYWFGTNGNGIIRYDGQTLENIIPEERHRWMAVRKIVEDKAGNIWFGTSSGLLKYDGKTFTTFSTERGFLDEEIGGLTIDKNGLIWVGTLEGICHFDGKSFTPFLLPDLQVANREPMLSYKKAGGFLEDKDGTMWISHDGNGLFKYKEGTFSHLTNENGLTDNHAGMALQDKQGHLWISTYYGGVSKYDGTTFTNYTKEGVIEGIETGSFCEDRHGNIWFSAENNGVYRYDGKQFTLFTTEDGLTSNGVQSIYEDRKGQLWFGTWHGLCIFDGEAFVNAKDLEPWTN